MEKSEIEIKYQKLASEYSKYRSHATVLKKAVLEEQAKNINLKEIAKEQELKIRKHDQEMESLTFRNEQLTKRIVVLQQELQINGSGKKSRSKSSDGSNQQQSNFSVIDEELQKKIIENARLASSMADKDMELENYREKIEWLEEKLVKLQTDLNEKTASHKDQIDKLKRDNKTQLSNHSVDRKNREAKECQKCTNREGDKSVFYQQEVDRWKNECDLLRSRPDANEQLTDYYESQIRDLFESKRLSQSELNSVSADNEALKTRLEHLILSKNAIEGVLDKSNEELHTTSENYRIQLDAMTEHLAAQNEKITKQCDEIQILKHKLSLKK